MTAQLRRYPAALLIALVLVLAGCGDDGEQEPQTPPGGQCAAPAIYLTQGKPSPCLTQGVIRTSDPAVICVRGQATRTRRELSSSEWAARRRQVLGRYGLERNPGQVDHLLPLSGGGSNDLGNLWPEAASQFKDKDRAEAGLHAAMCLDGRPRPGITADKVHRLQDAFLNQWRGAA